jgi:molybdopterin converting factor subunit 1
MRVTVRFFASHREATGLTTYIADVPDGSSAAEVLSSLYGSFPKLKSASVRVAFAINRNHVNPATPLRDGDELALLPPMAGG